MLVILALVLRASFLDDIQHPSLHTSMPFLVVDGGVQEDFPDAPQKKWSPWASTIMGLRKSARNDGFFLPSNRGFLHTLIPVCQKKISHCCW